MVFYGEIECQAVYKSGKKQGLACDNKAYYISDGLYVCGMHGEKSLRSPLMKNPNQGKEQEEKIRERLELVEAAAAVNRDNDSYGALKVGKLSMMKVARNDDGFHNVFPNFKHQNRKDGFGCAALSPMSLGPIIHGMKDFPDAMNLENYYQGAKIYASELEANNITQKSRQIRVKMYEDTTPYRHKTKYPGMKEKSRIPEFSVYYTLSSNEERRYTYLQSRYFYCHWYEKLACKTEDFNRLVESLENGYNLQILGYDGYNFPCHDEDVVEGLWRCYNDTQRPFGHEMVLFTLLTGLDESDYPWNRYYQENKELYEDMFV